MYLIMLCMFIWTIDGQQRSPPGVSPQHYQQPQAPPPPNTGHYQASPPGVPSGQYQEQRPPPPQYQQPSPPQYQQPQGTQYQQQQQQQGAQYQQQPQYQEQQQIHNANIQQQNMLHNPNLNKERDHIKDHLEVPLDTAGMSEQELQYHYFKMHDADNNNKLDGQELIKSLFHWHDAANHDPAKTGHPVPEAKIFTDEELVAMIDPILEQDDRNRDGYIDYSEFVQAQRKAASASVG